MARKEPTASGDSADGAAAGELETLSDETARIVRQRVVVAPDNVVAPDQ